MAFLTVSDLIQIPLSNVARLPKPPHVAGVAWDTGIDVGGESAIYFYVLLDDATPAHLRHLSSLQPIAHYYHDAITTALRETQLRLATPIFVYVSFRLKSEHEAVAGSGAR